MRPAAGGRHCNECNKPVHDLTRMTERAAHAYALLFGGQGLCARLLADESGEARFRPSLDRSRARSSVALPFVAAAATLGVGCASGNAEEKTEALSPTACAPAARIGEIPASPSSEPASVGTDGVAAAPPTRVIVTSSGDMEILRRVEFRPGGAVLDESSALLLDEMVKLLDSHPEITRVAVEGHADDVEARPAVVSRARADIVISYLVSRGVSAARLEPAGLAATRPLEEGKTPEARAKNRRVEFIIVSR